MSPLRKRPFAFLSSVIKANRRDKALVFFYFQSASQLLLVFPVLFVLAIYWPANCPTGCFAAYAARYKTHPVPAFLYFRADTSVPRQTHTIGKSAHVPSRRRTPDLFPATARRQPQFRLYPR